MSALAPYVAVHKQSPLLLTGPKGEDVDAVVAAALKKHRTRIKSLLLNQTFVRGLGNIYADEALFRAGIHPLALTSRIPTVIWVGRNALIATGLRMGSRTAGTDGSSWVES